MLAIRTILHPTDFSERSSYAFELAHALARDYNARLIVMHVSEPPTVLSTDPTAAPFSRAEYQEALEEKLRWLKGPADGVNIEPRLKEGRPATEILDTIAGCQCDLVIMGTHGRTGMGRLLMGSVAEEVLRKATCPVLIVKAPIPATAEAASPAGAEAALAR